MKTTNRHKKRPSTQKLYGTRRAQMLIDYFNHVKVEVIAATYGIEPSAPSGIARRYGINTKARKGRHIEKKTLRIKRDWLIVFIPSDNEEEIYIRRVANHAKRLKRSPLYYGALTEAGKRRFR